MTPLLRVAEATVRPPCGNFVRWPTTATPVPRRLLGELYDLGWGVPQDYAEAVKWYRLAANQGDAEAQANLGRMYEFGQGVPQNYAEAMKWVRLAVNQGNADAEFALGSMYYQGWGVPQSDAEAVKWFRLAANQGEARAQFTLGGMYDTGQGVPQDYVQAYMWFNLSAAQGNQRAAQGNQFNQWATEARDLIARRMTPAQIAEAQKLARQWRPEIANASPPHATPQSPTPENPNLEQFREPPSLCPRKGQR